MSNPRRGSRFDDWLEEEGLLEDAEAVATKRVLADQLREAMVQRGMSQATLARKMGTSRSSLQRLLDPKVRGVTLLTIERAARVLGKDVRIQLVNSKPSRTKTHTKRQGGARA